MRYGQILDVDRSTEVRIRWEPWRDSPTKESWVSASWLRPAPTLLADNQGVKLGDRVYHAVRDVRGTVKTLALRPGYGSEPYLTVIPDAVIPDGRGDESRVWTLRNLYMSQHAENIT